MLIQTILTAVWAGISGLAGNALSLERPLVCSFVVGIIYGNLPLGLAIGGTLELMWMGVEGIGGASPANVTMSSIFATAMACSLGRSVAEAVVLAVPVSLLANVIGQFRTASNSFFQRRFETLADEGKIDALCSWTLWWLPYVFMFQFLLIFFSVHYGAGPVEALLDAIPTWLTNGLGTAGGMLPAVGFAMVLKMMFQGKYAAYLAIGFVLGAYLELPILGVAIIFVGIAAVVFTMKQQIKQVGGQV